MPLNQTKPFLSNKTLAIISFILLFFTITNISAQKYIKDSVIVNFYSIPTEQFTKYGCDTIIDLRKNPSNIIGITEKKRYFSLKNYSFMVKFYRNAILSPG